MERHRLTFGPFQLNSASGTLLRGGEPLAVGQRGIRLLEALLQRPGEVLTKAELLDAAWPDMAVEEANLSVQIASLRKALGPAPGGGEWIATIPRVGYRVLPEASATDGTEAVGGDSRPPRPRFRGLQWAAALAAVAFAAVIGFAALRPAEVAPPVAASTNPSVAVLPFDDMSGNPELGYFGEGVSNDIIAMLARVPDLTVVARNSSFAYKGQTVDVRRIGAELGATHVLEGSVRKDADRVRIVAQLVDARTGKHVWAERFDRTGTDPWALQDEVTGRIVAALVGLGGTLTLQQYREAWGKDSADLQEYDYSLRSLARITQGTPEVLELNDAILKEGLSRFPDSSLLKAQSASTIVWRFARGWSDSANPLEDIGRAGELVREALADPAASPMMRTSAHITLAYVNMVEGKFDQAVVEAEAAIALAPYDGRIAYYLAEIPVVAGRPSLALEWLERAAALYPEDDPRQPELASMKAYAVFRLSGPQAAFDILDGIRGGDEVVLRTTYLMRAITLVMLGRADEAKAEIGKLRELDPTWTQEKHRKRFFHVDPVLLDATIQALAAAGLPEY